MSFLKATWWRPATALAVLALAVLALSLSGSGTAQAGNGGTVSIDPADKDIAAGGEGDVSIMIDPPASGTSIWIVQVKYDPTVAQVKLNGQDPVCTPMASPGQGIAQAAGCDIKDTTGDQVADTLVAFGGWVQNDGGTPRGFTTQQTAATFTFVAVGSAGAHTDLETTVTSMLGPNGEVGSPAENDGGIDIIESTGTNRTWGDSDCNGSVAPRDGQAILNVFLGKAPISQTDPCPDVNSAISGTGFANATKWGDFDCNGAVAPRDGQAILNAFLGKAPFSQTDPCPDVNASVPVTP
jgi:hypothetical protein